MNKTIKNLIRMALAEDLGAGDITTEAIVPKGQKARAVLLAKQKGVVAGLPLAEMVFQILDNKIKFRYKVKDGARIKKGQALAEVSGSARAILSGERLALNFLQRLSGIATLTSRFAALAKPAMVLDTRKTAPLWRGAERYAVLAGGGQNHRFGLYDAILIKDNHIKLAGGVKKAIEKAQAQKQAQIEVEAGTLSEVKEAIKAGANRILLDNMSLKTLRIAVVLCKKAGVKTEASGGVNLTNIRKIAKTGVDFISIGALTHSAPALDISLKML